MSVFATPRARQTSNAVPFLVAALVVAIPFATVARMGGRWRKDNARDCRQVQLLLLALFRTDVRCASCSRLLTPMQSRMQPARYVRKLSHSTKLQVLRRRLHERQCCLRRRSSCVWRFVCAIIYDTATTGHSATFVCFFHSFSAIVACSSSIGGLLLCCWYRLRRVSSAVILLLLWRGWLYCSLYTVCKRSRLMRHNVDGYGKHSAHRH